MDDKKLVALNKRFHCAACDGAKCFHTQLCQFKKELRKTIETYQDITDKYPAQVIENGHIAPANNYNAGYKRAILDVLGLF